MSKNLLQRILLGAFAFATALSATKPAGAQDAEQPYATWPRSNNT